VNKNPENSLFSGALALGARGRNPYPMKSLGRIASLLIVSLSLAEAAQSVELAWDPNSEPNIDGYVLRYGTIRGKPSQIIDVGKTTTAAVSNLGYGTTYFFTVTARNNFGLESPPSNEVSYTTAPLGAHKLTVINGTGSGNYAEGARVPVSANQSAAGRQFERWAMDYQILDNPSSPITTALMLFRDLTIEATYNAVGAKRQDPVLSAAEVDGAWRATPLKRTMAIRQWEPILERRWLNGISGQGAR
jgi:Fibronectin type III domain/Divergent InlB B-repeat domain